MEKFMPEMDAVARLQILKDTADKVEETQYYKPLGQEQLDVKREELTDNAIKLSEYEDDLNKVKVEFKSKMEPLRTQNKELLTQIKTKQELINGTIYHMANHESGYMETYDEEGVLIGTRRLRPDEKQKTIFQINKAS